MSASANSLSPAQPLSLLLWLSGVEEARIAKNPFPFFSADGEGCLLIVTAGDTKIDNKLFKSTFGFKAKMLPHDLALQMTGHAVGGVCPFALPQGVSVFLDRSLCRFQTIFPSAGSSSSAVEMTPEELFVSSHAQKMGRGVQTDCTTGCLILYLFRIIIKLESILLG